MRPRSCFPPLLSPWSPPPHSHSWFLGCGERGRGWKRGRQDKFPLGFHFLPPSSSLASPSGFLWALQELWWVFLFLLRKAESHLLQCRSTSMFPRVVTLCHPQTSTFRPRPPPPFLPLFTLHDAVIDWGGGLVHGAARRLMSCEPPCNAWTFQK